MSKKITKFGKMVLSIVVLVSLLAAASGKAEIIQSDRILYGESGNDWIEFSTDARGLLEDSYRFSRTFKLDSEGSYFTSVFLDPQYINMALRHTLNNLGLTDIPGYDVSGNYDITVSWEGAISITAGVQGDDNFKQKINSYEQSYTSNNINYDPDYLIEGTVGRVSSDSVNASFRNLNNITFVADELVGIDTITFDLFLNGITIESDAYTGYPT